MGAGKEYFNEQTRPDLERTKKVMGMSNKVSQFFKINDRIEVKAKGAPTANERLHREANEAFKSNKRTWRESKGGFLGKVKNTLAGAVGRGVKAASNVVGQDVDILKSYNTKGQCSTDTCVKFIDDTAEKANVEFPEGVEDNRNLIKGFREQGIKPHGRLRAKKGDIVVFSDPNKKDAGDWDGETARPYHIGIKAGGLLGKFSNKYISSQGGPTTKVNIYKKETKGKEIDYYTPQNKYKP